MAKVKAVADGNPNAADQEPVTGTIGTDTSVYRTTTEEVIAMANETAEKQLTENTTNDSDLITVNVGKNYDTFNTTMDDLQKSSQYPQRGHEAFMINKKTHSSIAIKQHGQINLAASVYSQYKLNPNGKAVEETMESVALTNRRKVNADDIVFNEHKLNPYLYELTDMRKINTVYNDTILLGNFCIYGSILVKAWEPDLKRYVLIRRPVKMPMFSPLLNVPEIHAGVGVTDPLKIDEEILLKSSKGYQVNKVQTDANSLIGKEGVDGEGINRNANIGISDNNNTTIVDGEVVSSSITSTSIDTPGGSNTEEKVWSFLKTEGFTDEGAAGVMGNIAQECSYDHTLVNDGGSFYDDRDGNAYGLLQWYTAEGKKGLSNKAKAMGGQVSDLNVQLAYMKDTAMGISNDIHGKSYGDNAWNLCKKETDIEKSARLWHDMVERAGYTDAENAMGNRIRYAKEAYSKHKGKTYAAASTNAPAVTTPVNNIDGMNAPGAGGGKGEEKVRQLIAYGVKAGNAKPSDEALAAVKAASQAAGIPMDWIMGMWIHEVGWSLAGNKSAVEFKNYGNMHGDSTKIATLKKAGVSCELAHWAADGTNDWVKFPNAAESGKGWAVWIRYAYSSPPACQQKTAENFYKCLFDNTGAGFKHGYAGDGTWAGSGQSYAAASLAVLKACGGGTVLT